MWLGGRLRRSSVPVRISTCFGVREVAGSLPAFSTSVTGGANDRHSGCGVRPRRGFYSTEIIKLKVSKGGKSVQNKQGDLVSSSCNAPVKEGQCSRRRGPGKGRSPVAARASLPGSGAQGGGFSWAASSSGGPAELPGRRPGILARQPSLGGGAVLLLDAPFPDPRGHQRACTGKRPVSRGEAQPAYNSGGDEAPFTSGVPHHAPPALAVSAPLLSHTPTPVGSLVKGGD